MLRSWVVYFSANLRQLSSYSGTMPSFPEKPDFRAIPQSRRERERERERDRNRARLPSRLCPVRRRAAAARRQKVSISGYFYPISLRPRPEQRGAEPHLLPTLYNRKAPRAFSAFSSYSVALNLESLLGIVPGEEWTRGRAGTEHELG